MQHKRGGEEAEIVLLAQCSDASGRAAPAAQGTGGDAGTAGSPQPLRPLSSSSRGQLSPSCGPGAEGLAQGHTGTPGPELLPSAWHSTGGTGGAVAAAGATSERPPWSSRERAVLPSKEMRSLPCAAHLDSPPCYFYLTFQGLFPFSGCFRCDSTIASTSFFPLPPSLPVASSFTLSFLSMHSFPGSLLNSSCL